MKKPLYVLLFLSLTSIEASFADEKGRAADIRIPASTEQDPLYEKIKNSARIEKPTYESRLNTHQLLMVDIQNGPRSTVAREEERVPYGK